MIRIILMIAFICSFSLRVQAENFDMQLTHSEEMMNKQGKAASVIAQDGHVLVRQITVDGFLLKEKSKFAKMFKKYRNKKLSTDEVNRVVDQVRSLYVEAGYENLVLLTYQIIKGQLHIFIALKK